MVSRSDNFQKYLIDKNDCQIEEKNEIAYLSETSFTNEIEGKCPGLKDAKYIYKLKFNFNMKELYDD